MFPRPSNKVWNKPFDVRSSSRIFFDSRSNIPSEYTIWASYSWRPLRWLPTSHFARMGDRPSPLRVERKSPIPVSDAQADVVIPLAYPLIDVRLAMAPKIPRAISSSRCPTPAELPYCANLAILIGRVALPFRLRRQCGDSELLHLPTSAILS